MHPPTPSFFLRTERLAFRTWAADDLDLAVGLWGDPLVTRLIDARGRLTRAQVQERLARELETERAHGVQYWPVFLRATGAHAGCCGLRPYDLPAGVYELGFHLRPACWGQGLAFEAASAVVGHAFGALRARGLFAGHHPDNHASQRLLLRLGFRYVGDAYFAPTGRHHPSYRLAPPTAAAPGGHGA